MQSTIIIKIMINKEVVILRKDCLGDIVIRNRNKCRWWFYRKGIVIGVMEITIVI